MKSKAPKTRIRPKIEPAARREAWKRHFVRTPALRDPAEGERHSTWLESFFDLAFAGAIGSLAFFLGTGYDFRSFAHFLLIYVPIMWCWVGQTFFLTRFDVNDIWQRFFTILQMTFVGGMAITGSESLQEGSALFALSYAACRLILVVQYYRTARHVPKARAYCLGMCYGFTVAMLFWVLSAVTPPPIRYGLWIFAIVIDLATPQFLTKHNKSLKVNPAHVPERFGLLVLIMISDIFVTQIGSLSGKKHGIEPLALGFVTFLVAVCAWWDYFEAVGGADPREMEDERSMKAFRSWMYLHFPFGAGLILLSGFSRLGITHGGLVPLSIAQVTVFEIAALLTLLTPIFLWYTLPHHFGNKDHFRLGFLYLYQLLLLIPLAFAVRYGGVLVGLGGIVLIYALRFGLQMRDSYLADSFETGQKAS